MHKSICDQYGPMPKLAGITVVPLTVGKLASLNQPEAAQFITVFLAFAGAAIGTIGANHIESYLKKKARDEKWGATKSSRIIQKAQLGSYSAGLMGGLLMSSFLLAVQPVEEENHRIDGEMGLGHEIILYQQPE